MLLLTRKIGERVLIGDSGYITVVGTKGGQVKIGFTFPPEVAILREEVAARDLAAKKGGDHESI